MLTQHKIEDMLGVLLLLGTLFSTAIVLLGGVIFLYQNGFTPLDVDAISSQPYHLYVISFVQNFDFSAISLIELGLLSLVATQLLRVGLLVVLYGVIKDYKFFLISLFIFFVLLYSFVLQK